MNFNGCFNSVFIKVSIPLTKYYSGDQIKGNEMGETCGTYGGQESCMQGFGDET